MLEDVISSRMLLAIRDYAAMKLGQDVADRAFERAVREHGSTVARATDPRGWVPLDVLHAVHAAFADSLGEEFIVDATTWVVPARRDLSAMSLSAVTTPDRFYANLDRARSFFAKHLHFEMHAEGPGRCRAELVFAEGVPSSPVSCLVGKAVLTAVPLLFDLPPAKVEKGACRNEGGERCTFHVTYASAPLVSAWGAAFGIAIAAVGWYVAPQLAWLALPVIGWLVGREVQNARARSLMARVTEEQRRVLAENETDFQRRFDEIKALNDGLEQRIAERTRELEDAMRVLREQNGALRASLEEMARLRSEVIEAAALKELQHEIANPMTYVLANLQELEGGAPEKADLGELESIVKDIRTGVDGIGNVVAWFLDLHAGAGAEPSRYDVAAEIDAAVRYLARRTGHRVQVHVKTEPLFVRGRGRQLTQVFVNVLKNATEALESGNVWIDARAEGSRALVTIKDDGPGMSPETLAHMFEPGFTTKPAGKGSGLGLHISRRIVDRHDGAIGVTSAPGAGTTFRIDLPLWTP